MDKDIFADYLLNILLVRGCDWVNSQR